MKAKNKYWKLFASSFTLSAFTFGGGFVIISLMKKKYVDHYKWLEEEEMINMTSIAQSSPGAVAVNASLIVGYHIGGIFGAILTVLGTILPPLLILSVLSIFYTQFKDNLVVNAVLKGMQAGVAAVIADVVIKLGSNVLKERRIISYFIMIGAFVATYFYKINVFYIILLSGVIGALNIILSSKKKVLSDKQ